MEINYKPNTLKIITRYISFNNSKILKKEVLTKEKLQLLINDLQNLIK